MDIPDELPLQTAAQVIRHAAMTHGDHPLLIMPLSRLSFRQAEALSGALARKLLMSGVGKGTRVGLHFDYDPGFIIGLLAVTRIGALAVPLSTASTPGELLGALKRADVDTLLVPPLLRGHDELRLLEEAVPELSQIETLGERLLCQSVPYLRQIRVLGPSSRPWATGINLDGDVTPIDDRFLATVEGEVYPADLFVMIQTSGSTAEPKAVLHSHGAVFRKSAHNFGISGPIFLGMPFFWVGGLLSLCTALQTGTTLVCQERFDPAEALDLIETHRVALVASWFTVTDALRKHPSTPTRDLSCIPMLMMDPATMAYLTPLGMTETLGPHTSIPHPDYGMSPPNHLRGSNGAGGPHIQHRLIDPNTGEVIEGDGEGELCVRGAGVTVGLYKREREVVFDADGWYHTGDRVARRDDLWWFVGRETEMIKSRGANVAPLEVEAVLEMLPEIEHSFVFGVPNGRHDEIVAALLVPRDGTTIDLTSLTEHARGRLAAYKVPTIIEIISKEDVVWLPTGKPDKRAMQSRLLSPQEVPTPTQ